MCSVSANWEGEGEAERERERERERISKILWFQYGMMVDGRSFMGEV